jgi:hypothetical protein
MTCSASALIFPDDYPKRAERLPRALAGSVSSQRCWRTAQKKALSALMWSLWR